VIIYNLIHKKLFDLCKKEKWKISIAKKNGIWYNKQAYMKRELWHMVVFCVHGK
jgi:hypothetical protein